MRMIRTVKQWIAEKKKMEYEKIVKRELLSSQTLKVNPLTGQINLKYNVNPISEDFFIGLRGEPSNDSASFTAKPQ